MNFRRRKAQTRKKLVATVNRCEGVYNRAGEPNVTSGGKEEQRRERALIFATNRSKRYKACSDVSLSDKKDARLWRGHLHQEKKNLRCATCSPQVWHPLRESNTQLALRRGLLYPFN